jgi:pyruvate,water dikinase
MWQRLSRIFIKRESKPQRTPEEIADLFRYKYSNFKDLLHSNSELAKILSDLSVKLQGYEPFGMAYVRSQATLAVSHSARMIRALNALSENRYGLLSAVLEKIHTRIKQELEAVETPSIDELVLPYCRVTREMVDWVGGKNANLGEVRNRAGLAVPEGFAVTTRAFQLFLAENDLVDRINKLKTEVDPRDPQAVHALSESIQHMVLTAGVPDPLRKALEEAFDTVQDARARKTPGARTPLRVAMRSSAIGEDTELSYAGQYVSMLNTPRERLAETYRIIAAGLYTPRAITYRFNKGIRDEDVAMAVACLEMIDSVASGVVYSRNPVDPSDDRLVVSAVWGLGPYAVDGTVTPDTYRVARGDRLTIVERKVSVQTVQLVADPDGGLKEIEVPESLRAKARLDDEQILQLAGFALKLERHFGSPQDIEWALAPDGRLLILQSRPLHPPDVSFAEGRPRSARIEGYHVILEGGNTACPGVGYGPAFHVQTEEDLLHFPEGAVLVARHSSPAYAVVIPRAAAIVTDAGSVTGHMASIAREFSVPTLLGTLDATERIPPGVDVTVDASSGRVYRGQVKELLGPGPKLKPFMKGTPVHDTLKRVTRHILPINLVDPKAPDFRPESCETLHDIMRFVHERSYEEMFRLSDAVSNGEGWAVKVEADIPIDLFLIDLGGGLVDVKPGDTKVSLDRIACEPLRALLAGMTRPELRHREPRPIHLGGFLSVMTEQMFSPPRLDVERFGDRSYAIVSEKYLNFSSRVGYHYSILDTYCGETVNKNYITFSFMGGAADETRRNRRARAIARILEALGFVVTVAGDRVTGRYVKYERKETLERLDRIGRMLQYTRQMDMLMDSEQSVEVLAANFIEERYRL